MPAITGCLAGEENKERTATELDMWTKGSASPTFATQGSGKS